MLESLGNLPSAIVTLAGSAVGAFVLAVVIDDLLGVALAVKSKTFDANKLPSFLESQFGTKQALALAGAIGVAVITGSQPDVHAAALTVLALGGYAMTAALISDIKDKLVALVSGDAKQAEVPAQP